MSWWSRNFPKKQGGSRGGNLLRRVASATLSKLTLGIYDGTTDGGPPVGGDGEGKRGNFIW